MYWFEIGEIKIEKNWTSGGLRSRKGEIEEDEVQEDRTCRGLKRECKFSENLRATAEGWDIRGKIEESSREGPECGETGVSEDSARERIKSGVIKLE